MSILTKRRTSASATAPRPSARARSLAAFHEAFSPLDRDAFLDMFRDPFLVSQVSADPATWRSAWIVPVAKRSEVGKIAIASEVAATDDLERALDARRIVIGRDKECDVVVSVPSVSKRHAAFARTELGWTLVDLGSSNGTELEGKHLVANRPARIGRTPASIGFGPDVDFAFFTPEALHDFLAAVRGGNAPAAPLRASKSASPPLSDTERVQVDGDALANLLEALRRSTETFQRVEAGLDTGVELVELFRGGTPAELARALECLGRLGPLVKLIRLTPATGEPFVAYRRS